MSGFWISVAQKKEAHGSLPDVSVLVFEVIVNFLLRHLSYGV